MVKISYINYRQVILNKISMMLPELYLFKYYKEMYIFCLFSYDYFNKTE